MPSAAVSVANDPRKLKAEVLQLRLVVEEKEQALSEKSQRIEQLLDYILLLRKRQFGAKADRPNKDQISLFDEAELEQLLVELGLADDADEDKPSPAKKASGEKKKPVRRALPANLNRIEKIIDLSDEEKAAMGCDFNRSMQHLHSHYREEDVENEAATENLLYRNGQGIDVGSLAERRVSALNCPAFWSSSFGDSGHTLKDRRDTTAAETPFATRVDTGRTRGDLAWCYGRPVVSFDRSIAW